MATKDDIESDIVLEMGDDITPEQLVKAVNALTGLLNAAHKKASKDKKNKIKWRIQVKQGSNLVGYYAKEGNATPAIDVIQNCLQNENEFDEGMTKNVNELCALPDPCLWLNHQPFAIGEKIERETGYTDLQGYGTINGKIEVLNSHKDNQFRIYKPLINHAIVCTAKDDNVFKTAWELFGKLVEAKGLIDYNARGIPHKINVDSLSELPKSTLKSYTDVLGILKKYV